MSFKHAHISPYLYLYLTLEHPIHQWDCWKRQKSSTWNLLFARLKIHPISFYCLYFKWTDSPNINITLQKEDQGYIKNHFKLFRSVGHRVNHEADVSGVVVTLKRWFTATSWTTCIKGTFSYPLYATFLKLNKFESIQKKDSNHTKLLWNIIIQKSTKKVIS